MIKQEQMKLLLVVQCIALLLISQPAVVADKTSLEMESLQPVISSAESTLQGNLNGELFSINSNGKIYSIFFNAGSSQASVKELFLENSTRLVSESDGSGEPFPEESTNQELVFDILHHHLYVVFERTIYIIFLNSSTDFQTFETIAIDYNPISIRAFKFGHDPYIMATYTTPEDRTYIRRYRKFQNTNWGIFGDQILVASPHWFDLNRISNVLVYKALDTVNFYNSLYVVVGERWYVYRTNLIEGTSESFLTPEPCNNIEKFVYSEHEQRMLIQCREGIVLLDAKEREFSNFWIDISGDTFIADSGLYGAVVNESFVTILEMSSSYRARAVPVDGVVSNAVFVDVDSDNHYFCFVQQYEESYSVYCISIETLFENGTDYLLSLFDSSVPPMDQLYSNCSSLYSHRNLLTIEHVVCSASPKSCLPLMQIFDMGNILNSFNVSGLQARLLVYKARKYEVSATNAPNITHTLGTTYEEASTTQPRTLDTTTSSSTVPASIADELEQCNAELQEATRNFHILLYVSLAILVLFAVLIIILCLLLCCAIRKIKYHGLYDPYNQVVTLFRVSKRRNAPSPPDKENT